jgi:hypothetical protein
MPIEPRLIVTSQNPEGDGVFVEDRHPQPVRVQALPKSFLDRQPAGVRRGETPTRLDQNRPLLCGRSPLISGVTSQCSTIRPFSTRNRS